PETQILVGEVGTRARRPTPLHQLLEGAAAVEARARATAVPALADPVGLLRRPDARLEVRQLHLLPHPVDDVVDLELEQQLDLALIAPAGALLARSPLFARIGEHVPGF